MSAAVYLATSVAWSIAGFVAGWVLGRATRDVRQIREALVDDDTTRDQDRPELNGRHVVGTILIVLALASVAAMSWQVTQRQSEVECHTEVLRETINTLDARGRLVGDDRDALTQLINVVFQPETTPAEAKAAHRAYLRDLDETADRRAQLDYPEDRCGEDR